MAIQCSYQYQTARWPPTPSTPSPPRRASRGPIATLANLEANDLHRSLMPKKSEWASSSRRAGLQNRPTFRPFQNHILKHMGRSILVTSHLTGQVPGCRAEWVPEESSLHGASAGVMLTRDN